MVGEERRVQLWRAAVGGVGQREQPAQIGVALARGGEQHDARAACQRQFAAGDRPDAEAVRKPRELQRPAQVRIGERQRAVAVLPGLRQQLVRMRCAQPEGVEAPGVQLDVGGVLTGLLTRSAAGTSRRLGGRGRASAARRHRDVTA